MLRYGTPSTRGTRMTHRTPAPRAPPTSSLPARAGRCVRGRNTNPRASPSGFASARMPRSGPLPLNSSDRRSSALSVPASRVAAVSARPRAAVAVGSVPWRRRASSTTPVVTAARPRTVPSTESVRATRSATAGLRGGYELPHGPEQVLRRDRADEPPPLAPAGIEQQVGRNAGHVEALQDRLHALVARSRVDLEGGEGVGGAHHRGVAERRPLHLPARQAPVGPDVDQHGTAGRGRPRQRLLREGHPRDRAPGIGADQPAERHGDEDETRELPRPPGRPPVPGRQEAEYDARRDPEEGVRRTHGPGTEQRREEVNGEAQEEEGERALDPFEPRAGARQAAEPACRRGESDVGRAHAERQGEEEREAERGRLPRPDEEQQRHDDRADTGGRHDAHREPHEEGAEHAVADAPDAPHERGRHAEGVEPEVARREHDQHERDGGQHGRTRERRAEPRAGPRRGPPAAAPLRRRAYPPGAP